MKKHNKKRGFTLVECIVAMAVLTVMSLLLTMIMSVTIKQRNRNMELEREIDQQVEGLAVGSITDSDGNTVTTTSEAYSDTIDFVDSSNNTIASIDNLSKVYIDEGEVQIGALGYESTEEYDFGSGSSGSSGSSEGTSDSTSSKLYGAADLSGYVYIDESKTESGDNYVVTWTVKYTANSYSEEKAIKVVLPTGATSVTFPTSSYTNYSILKISQYVVRIQPAEAAYSEALITFTIPKDDYSDVAAYFKNGSGTSVSLTLNS